MQYQEFTNLCMLYLLIAASFSINLPIAFGSVCLTLFLVFWLISGSYLSRLSLILMNPGARISLMLLGLYTIGVTYSSATWHDSIHYLAKYAKILIIPFAITVITTDKHRNYVINGFLISLIGYLIVSYLNWLGFFEFGVMRHGTYMAVGMYFMLRNAYRKIGFYRTVWTALAVLTALNILFVADVRTGVVTMFALLLIFF